MRYFIILVLFIVVGMTLIMNKDMFNKELDKEENNEKLEVTKIDSKVSIRFFISFLLSEVLQRLCAVPSCFCPSVSPFEKTPGFFKKIFLLYEEKRQKARLFPKNVHHFGKVFELNKIASVFFSLRVKIALT